MPERHIRKTEQSPAFDRLPLNALRVFEAVATQLSFAAAAERLNVTPAAVSMQIRTLEQYVQLPLFRRKGRSIELTSEALHLLPGVRRGLNELQQAMHQLRHDRAGGPLNISTLSSFLQKWLLPRLPQFQELFPKTDLRIHTSREVVDFSQSDFHAAIRMMPGPAAGLYSEKLMDEWFLPVCSPEMMKRLGPIRTAQDLKRYSLLRSADESWTLWTRPIGEQDWKEHGTAYDDSLTVLAAAEQGQGLALTRWSLAAGDLESGRIVRPSPRAVPCPRSYYFVCPEAYLTTPKVSHMLEWLRTITKSFPAPGAREAK
jgi:LysR family transcriptional regulator, glycine cleavage system transcriptional activator